MSVRVTRKNYVTDKHMDEWRRCARRIILPQGQLTEFTYRAAGQASEVSDTHPRNNTVAADIATDGEGTGRMMSHDHKGTWRCE